MYRKINSLVGIMISSLSIATIVNSDANAAEEKALFSCLTSYIGISGERVHYRFDRQFGAPLYNRNLMHAGLIAGLQLNPFMGIEFEYNLGQRTNKIRHLKAGDYSLVTPVAISEGEIYQTHLGIDSLNLSITTNIPLDFMNIADTSLYGSFGGTLLKIKAKHYLIDGDLGVASPDEQAASLRKYYSGYRKLIPTLKYGLQRKITDHLAIRIFGSWKKMSGFNTTSYQLDVGTLGYLNFKSAVGYGFSLIYNF